jgi:hypothetical protein
MLATYHPSFQDFGYESILNSPLHCEENSNIYGEYQMVVEEMSVKVTFAYY